MRDPHDKGSPLRQAAEVTADAPKHPVWYLNLVANPEVTLQDGDQVLDLRARTADAKEKRHWWPRLTAAWPPYDKYQSSTERDIPVVLLEADGA